jgi:hypothetical protein
MHDFLPGSVHKKLEKKAKIKKIFFKLKYNIQFCSSCEQRIFWGPVVAFPNKALK